MANAEPVKLSKLSPTELRWTPTGSDVGFFQVSNNDGSIYITCLFADTGRFTVPKDIEAKYPNSGSVALGVLNDDYSNLENRRVAHFGFDSQVNEFFAK
ncbi:MAG: hypothetical protein ACRCYY_09755 [Trueperaceae bacterium]